MTDSLLDIEDSAENGDAYSPQIAPQTASNTAPIDASAAVAPIAPLETPIAPAASKSFLDSLPEDIRGEASLRDFKDMSALAKSYVNAQKMLGNSIRIPGADASDEVKNEFYQKMMSVPGVMRAPDPHNPEAVDQIYSQLGKPKTSDAYRLELPEGVQLAEADIKSFNEQAHALGLTQKQYEGIMQTYVGNEIASIEASNAERADGEAQLRQMWGPEFNQRLEAAKVVAKAYGEKYPDAMEMLKNSPAGNNPVILSMMAELAPIFQERGAIGGTSKFQFGTSSEEAAAQLKEIESNMDHPYYKSSDPSHAEAKARVKALYQIVYPD